MKTVQRLTLKQNEVQPPNLKAMFKAMSCCAVPQTQSIPTDLDQDFKSRLILCFLLKIYF